MTEPEPGPPTHVDSSAPPAPPVDAGASDGIEATPDVPSGGSPLGRRALVWSFFIPPAGLVLGAWALRVLPNDDANRPARGEARLAMLNGVVSTVLIVKGIYILIHLREWMEAWLYGGLGPGDF